MSNKSRGYGSQMPASARRGIAQPPRQGFLSQLAQGMQEKGEQLENQEPQDDLNVLPFPVTQEISEKFIQWRWEPCNFVRVYAILYTQNQTRETSKGPNQIAKGYFEVQFSTELESEVTNGNILSYSAEEAKAIGQAMVSASNWINVWKDHAGMFLEKEFLGDTFSASDE